MGSRILITGGAGFIGSRLVKSLSKTADVFVYDALLPQVHAGNESNSIRAKNYSAGFYHADIRDQESLSKAVKEINPDIIYHLAAETGTGQSFDELDRYNGVNVMGTVYLIEAIRKNAPNLRQITLAGSRSVYGEGAYVDEEGRPKTAVERTPQDLETGDFAPKSRDGKSLIPAKSNSATPVQPASVYASTKLMQEYLLKQSFWGTSTNVSILRLQNVFGEGQSLKNPYTGVISIFIQQILDGKTLNIFEDGQIFRDFVHVNDVVAAFASTMDRPLHDEIADIGTGEAVSILEAAQLLLKRLGRDENKLRITGNFRSGDIRYACADTTVAKNLLGWNPTITFEEGIQRVIDWSTNKTDDDGVQFALQA